MRSPEPERTRAAFGLAVLSGVFVVVLGALPMLPLLGSPLGFLAAGAAGAVPTFALLARRIGGARAAMLAGVVALTLAVGLMAVGNVAWLLAG